MFSRFLPHDVKIRVLGLSLTLKPLESQLSGSDSTFIRRVVDHDQKAPEKSSFLLFKSTWKLIKIFVKMIVQMHNCRNNLRLYHWLNKVKRLFQKFSYSKSSVISTWSIQKLQFTILASGCESYSICVVQNGVVFGIAEGKLDSTEKLSSNAFFG